jgi:molecular chaperone DnaK
MRDEVQVRNVADNAAYNAEKMVRENQDKIPADLKSEIESNIETVRNALKGTDVAAINAAMETLQNSVQKVGQIVYSQTGGDGGAAPGGEGQPPPEGTVEGEFREV